MTGRRRATGLAWLRAMAIASAPLSAFAEPATPQELAAMRAEIGSLRAEQAERATELRRAEARLAALEVALARLEAPAAGSPAHEGAHATPDLTTLGPGPHTMQQGLQLSGDLRVRYESNNDPTVSPDRKRGVVRGRLRAGYAISDRLFAGAMLSTGDPSNPRTGDVTLGGFGADLQVKLAQAYLRGDFGALQLVAGKMPQPFLRTELVWDGDVNPQGLSANYRLHWGNSGTARLTGLYFFVDEAAAGPDSHMVGSQLSIGTDLSPELHLDLAAAYYDYTLNSAPGTSPATFRGNLIAPDGGYLSDFDLANAMLSVSYTGFGLRWPAKLVFDYVKNFGAAVADDNGFELDLTLGRASQRGDWRLMYGYSEAAVDAVLGAFSSDNTDLPTNYLQHTLSVDYMLSPKLTLNATAYHYRPKNPVYAGPRPSDEWISRYRLNLQLAF